MMRGNVERLLAASVLTGALAFAPAFTMPDLLASETASTTAMTQESADTDTQSLLDKVAQLESEVAALEKLIGMQSDTDSTADNTDTQADSKQETEAVQQKNGPRQETDAQQFIQAAVASCNARVEEGNLYSAQELASLSEAQLIDYYGSCVDTEVKFYERYAKAKFSDKNLSYLCYKYRLSIERQRAVVMNYQAGGGIDRFNEEWDLGYFDRAMALVELHDYYGAAFGDDLVDIMRTDLSYDKLIKKGLEGNAGVSADTVMYVQTLLNNAGYDCGSPDGDCGKATVRAIRHFQEMYGTIVDGLIDSELVTQLGG